MSNRVEHQKLNQVAAELPPGWVFGVQLGLRQTQALIKTKTIRGKVPLAILVFSCKLLLKSNIAGGTFLLLIVLALISACVCRRPSWTPKTQPGGSSAVTWLSFWCSTRLLMSVKKCLGYRGKTCREAKFQLFRNDMKFHWNFGSKVSQSFNRFHKISQSFIKPYFRLYSS